VQQHRLSCCIRAIFVTIFEGSAGKGCTGPESVERRNLTGAIRRQPIGASSTGTFVTAARSLSKAEKGDAHPRAGPPNGLDSGAFERRLEPLLVDRRGPIAVPPATGLDDAEPERGRSVLDLIGGEQLELHRLV
jgi:hypothetical protein